MIALKPQQANPIKCVNRDMMDVHEFDDNIDRDHNMEVYTNKPSKDLLKKNTPKYRDRDD